MVARVIILCAIASLAGITNGLIGDSAICSAAERWTTLDGSRTVEAKFIGLWGNKVVLEMPGPRRVSVSVDDLIAESRIQARRLGEEQQRQRAEIRQQIQTDANEASAPAPTPLPKPRTPPEYQPLASGSLASGSGLMAQIEWWEQQSNNGHALIAVFDMLPPNYQNDLERMVRASVAKLDMQGAQQLLSSVHSIGDLVVTRQRWIFSYPRLAAEPDAQATVKGFLLPLAGLIRDGIDPSQLKIEEIATTPLRTWVAVLDRRIAPYVAAMYSQYERSGGQPASYEVQNEKGGKATLEITHGEIKQTVKLVTVEGKWVLEDWDAEKWAESMKSWETSLAEAPDGSLLAGGQAMVVTAMISSQVEKGMTAKSARDLHAVMDGWMTLASPMIAPLMTQMGGGARGRSGMGREGMGMEGMGMEGMGMEDMEMEMDDMEGMEMERSMRGQGFDQ